jgi:ribose transport system ATP-binding protein
LLVDEPTQGVDIAAKAEIHRHLRSAAEQGRCIVVSCSDPMELVDLCDRVLVLRRGRVVADLRGSDVTADRISRISIHGGSDQ